VQAPSNAPEQYFNRYLYHSINVQLIAGPDLKIYNVFVEFPGSNHDSYIWRNSAVRNAFEEGGTFPEGWLVADSGYPQEPWVAPVANVTSPAEHLYNSVHISTRNPIEIGPCIDNIILKNTSNKAKVQLIYIINGALKLNYFPNQYKTAIVIPIPKTG
jgi:hypothetical protein